MIRLGSGFIVRRSQRSVAGGFLLLFPPFPFFTPLGMGCSFVFMFLIFKGRSTESGRFVGFFRLGFTL